jgi:hypothetical protein
MTRPEAHEALRRLALGVRDADEGAAVARLLERIAKRDDAAELRDALAEAGARVVLGVPVGAEA